MNKPIFCPDCKNRDTFERNHSKDRYSEDGKLLYEAYKCKVCGYSTIARPEGGAR